MDSQGPAARPMPRRDLVVLFVLGGLVAVGAAAGYHSVGANPLVPAPAQTAPAPPPVVGIGAPLVTGNWQLTVLQTHRTKTLGTGASGPTAKGEYLVVELAVVNRGAENFGLNTWDFELVDGAGHRYDTDRSAVGLWAKAMPGEAAGGIGRDTDQLPPNVTGKYNVVYDVDPDAQGLQLRFKQTGAAVRLAEPGRGGLAQ